VEAYLVKLERKIASKGALTTAKKGFHRRSSGNVRASHRGMMSVESLVDE
jgi:hypothetical protein